MEIKANFSETLSDKMRRIYLGTKKDGTPDKRCKNSYMQQKGTATEAMIIMEKGKTRLREWQRRGEKKIGFLRRQSLMENLKELLVKWRMVDTYACSSLEIEAKVDKLIPCIEKIFSNEKKSRLTVEDIEKTVNNIVLLRHNDPEGKYPDNIITFKDDNRHGVGKRVAQAIFEAIEAKNDS